MIEIKNLSVKYNSDFYSLYNLNLKIDRNTLILGDRLSGGFALMQVLAKFKNSYWGEVLIDDVNVKKIKNKNLDLAFVSYTPTLFKNKTVKVNLMYPLIMRKVKREKCNALVTEITNLYGVDYIDKKAKKLTESEAKIICLLRAIIRQPKIILLEHFFENLDEPSTFLANKIISQIEPNCLVIATENATQPCYENYKVEHFENGSLITPKQ